MRFRPLLTACMIVAMLPALRGQDEEKARKLFQDAVDAMGGDAYLAVTDMVSSGNFFVFNRYGESSGLIKFDDYTKLPDKSRYEEGNKKKLRDVTVFNLEKSEGWILEGQKATRDATPDEMESFKKAAKHSLDNIFRTRFRDPANKLFYLGPGDGDDVRLEIVKLLDPENDEVTVYFDRMSRLPAKIQYQVTDKDGNHYKLTEEYSQWHDIQDVNTPLRIDTFINGRQSSQRFIIKIAYNNGLDDSFFSKPEPPK